MSGLGLPRVGEGEEGEEAEEEEDNAGDGSPLSVVSGVRKKKKNPHTKLPWEQHTEQSGIQGLVCLQRP